MSDAEAPATIVVDPGGTAERAVPVFDWLVVGREAQGIDDRHRLLVADDTVSRRHLEIRLDPGDDRADLVDLSTNGTRVNGVRVERAVPVPLHPGDRLTVGGTDLEFRSEQFRGSFTDRRRTSRYVSESTMALVVGDIVGYSTLSERTDSTVVLNGLEALYDGLRRLLVEHRGTLNAYAGDALFAVWDADPPDGVARAVDFARAARAHVRDVSPSLPIRNLDDSPVRMGWAVVLGTVAVSTLTQAQPAVIGDTTNLAFRLSGVAARDGRADIVVTDRVRDTLGDRYAWAGPDTVQVKGRSGAVSIFGLHE
jgi:class 3 adenylate cyclase